MSERVFQIGAGRVGRGLNRAFSSSGIRVTGLHGRRPSPGATSYGSFPVAIGDANVILVSVPDGLVETVMEELVGVAQSGKLARGTVILHTSPVAEPETLAELGKAGFPGGTFHPLIPFTDPSRAGALLRTAWIGIDGEPSARGSARRLAAAVGARTLEIPSGKKSAYHAAAVMASTFPIVIASVVERLLQNLGVSESSAAQAVESLMTAAIAGDAGTNPDEAFGGPIARGDAVTVGKHINALRSSQEALAVYRAISTAAIEIAARQGLDQERIAMLRGTITATARAAPTGIPSL